MNKLLATHTHTHTKTEEAGERQTFSVPSFTGQMPHEGHKSLAVAANAIY